MRKIVKPKKAAPIKKVSKKDAIEKLLISFHYDGDVLSANTLSMWSGLTLKQTLETLNENSTKFFLKRKSEDSEAPERDLWSNRKV